jgi:hypothetical protein
MAFERRSRMSGWFRAMTLTILLACFASPAQGFAQATPTTDDAQLTGLVESVLSPPRWFTGSDGNVHLVYELVLTNPLPADVTVTSVDVLDAASGESLTRLEGASLLAAMSLVAQPDDPAVALPPSSVGVVWFDLLLTGSDALPEAVAHRLTISLPDGVPVPDSFLSFTGKSVEVDRRPPVVLGPPLAGPQWLALGSCCDGPHRRALYPIDGRLMLGQRFAIDFNLLEADNRPGTGDPSHYTSYPTFGQPVLAVADATVVDAIDAYPDLLVGEAREDVTPQNAGGNRIILDLGDGRFAVYAHLQAGSVQVSAGDQVERGQLIAAAGSSGTSGGPHLHFQVTDRASVIDADGLPFVFDAFDVTGQTPPLMEVVPYYDTFEGIPITTEGAGPRTDELPLASDVIAFPPVDANG